MTTEDNAVICRKVYLYLGRPYTRLIKFIYIKKAMLLAKSIHIKTVYIYLTHHQRKHDHYNSHLHRTNHTTTSQLYVQNKQATSLLTPVQLIWREHSNTWPALLSGITSSS